LDLYFSGSGRPRKHLTGSFQLVTCGFTTQAGFTYKWVTDSAFRQEGTDPQLAAVYGGRTKITDLSVSASL